MSKCSVDVPKHFLDGETAVSGGVQEVEIEDALRWENDGKAVILDATVKPKKAPEPAPVPAPEPPKAKPAKSDV